MRYPVTDGHITITALPDQDLDGVCDRCGSVVRDPDVHIEWHQRLQETARAARTAKRAVSRYS